MTRGLTKCKETAEGSPKGHGLIVLKMNCLCVSVGAGVIWLISSVITLLTKKAQRTHEEVTIKKSKFHPLLRDFFVSLHRENRQVLGDRCYRQ